MRLLIFVLAFSSTLCYNQYCLAYNSEGKCVLCVDSYNSGNKDDLCLASKARIENCLSYLTEQKCLACLVGYKLNKGKCVPIEKDDKCLWSAVSGVCMLCLQSHYATNGVCKLRETPTIVNCVGYGSNTKGEVICQRCREGYTVYFQDGGNKSECVESTGNLENCWSTYDTRSCAQCHVNFFLEAVKCPRSTAYQFETDYFIVDNIPESDL